MCCLISLHDFEGAVVHQNGTERIGLDANNLLLRGCTLRKTDWICGLVVYTGADTKVQQNMISAPRKVTQEVANH